MHLVTYDARTQFIFVPADCIDNVSSSTLVARKQLAIIPVQLIEQKTGVANHQCLFTCNQALAREISHFICTEGPCNWVSIENYEVSH